MAMAIDFPVSGVRAGQAGRVSVLSTITPAVLKERWEKREARDAAG